MKREMNAYYGMHKLYDLVNFIVCFVVPLAVITVLYTFICLRLWRSQEMLRPKKSYSINGAVKATHAAQVTLDGVSANPTAHLPRPPSPDTQVLCQVSERPGREGHTRPMRRFHFHFV